MSTIGQSLFMIVFVLSFAILFRNQITDRVLELYNFDFSEFLNNNTTLSYLTHVYELIVNKVNKFFK